MCVFVCNQCHQGLIQRLCLSSFFFARDTKIVMMMTMNSEKAICNEMNDNDTLYCVCVVNVCSFGLLCVISLIHIKQLLIINLLNFRTMHWNHPGHFRISKHVLILVNLHAFTHTHTHIIIWYRNNIKIVLQSLQFAGWCF